MVSTDFGSTWQERRAGLPVNVIGNIEAMGLHHTGDDIMLTAGTATGEVYVSYDRAQSWEAIELNAPPISKAGHYRWFLSDERRAQIEDAMRAWKPEHVA
ncbi:hypothetical protein [Neopusillimonas aromaticivorans]|uniref:hypothetical protein n=1 Tax=Neopusillimonas aromaticivorans TaxID=2979868 RepID=UPI0025942CCB|nr:hypothetical protein [Neopusillimonas aromaticivorans]WJJ94510.1 hypothetical protein N7E01_05980 [Neopusillimonas aromaticivorans]